MEHQPWGTATWRCHAVHGRKLARRSHDVLVVVLAGWLRTEWHR